MDLVKDLLVVTGRLLTILPLMLFVALYMGKRSIGEIPVFDFLVILTLGSVVGADIADPNVPHIHTAVAIILIGLLQIIVSKAIIKHRKLGHLITFEPSIVIQDGQFIVKNLKKLRYSIDNVLSMLREKDVFDINDIHLGIIEATGNLSLLKIDSKAVVTLEDMNLTKNTPSLSYPLIVDGKIHSDILIKLDLPLDWLKQQLMSLNIKTTEEVFFASINTNNELHVSLKSFMNDNENTIPIYH
ncbi:DUF421 domain-containing protein [Clostridium sp.]|jgi:uncharacterized membrane protein YcaP (DUF421 family)|uniref:DUF421 domain-containing protein n=1 Tax=Clostridium sp. TaxID=1506 RepID=UPI003EE899D7